MRLNRRRKLLLPIELQNLMVMLQDSRSSLERPSAGRAIADMLVDMAQCNDLFHTASGTAFADIMTDGHRETWPIRSKRFRAWLRRCYYQATGDAPSAAAIRSTLDLLEARAQFDGPERAVHIRIAEHAGHIYLDLADEHWRAIDIGPDGWRVVESPPVRFRRPAGMLTLPIPEQGGSIETLYSFLNLASRNDFVLSSHGCWRRCDPGSVSATGDIRRAGLGKKPSSRSCSRH